jgi:hypothetical protein
MKKAISIIVLLLSILTLFCGCSSGVDMPDGLQAGFYYEDCDDPYFFHYSAFRSAKTEFDIDDVTINLYYGLEAGYNSGEISFSEGYLLRIASINRNDYSDYINADTKQIDIREISGF